jgi:hypothetical protein
MNLRLLLLLVVFANTAIAGPWFTGPLLAPAGRTMPKGHLNFEPYGFYSDYPGGYHNIETVPVLTVGVTDFLDLQTAVPYDFSWKQGQNGNGVGDYSVAVGLQILRQSEKTWLPDLRFVLQEVFPTGRFENLNPNKLGTDQTGLGSYQTLFGLNFQKLFQLKNEHYLRTRLSLAAVLFSDVHVHGVNVFGGGSRTDGTVKLDNSYSVDLAFEYTLTQKWVPVFEVLYAHSPGSHFDGNPGFTPDGVDAGVGGGKSEQVSLAPALEYNFNSNIGIIGGVWFSVTGPHSATFTSGVVAINIYI